MPPTTAKLTTAVEEYLQTPRDGSRGYWGWWVRGRGCSRRNDDPELKRITGRYRGLATGKRARRRILRFCPVDASRRAWSQFWQLVASSRWSIGKTCAGRMNPSAQLSATWASSLAASLQLSWRYGAAGSRSARLVIGSGPVRISRDSKLKQLSRAS